VIDFKKALKATGTKAVLRQTLPSIPAFRSWPGSKDWEQITVQFEIRQGTGNLKGEWWLHLHGGPTGYESVDLVKLLSQEHEPGAKWIACMGSDRYSRLEIRIDNIRQAVRDYKVGYQFEVL